MPCLKKLELAGMKALVRTPDISGLPCLQNLIIKRCGSLEEIHESLGNHKSLVNLQLFDCSNLARFPTIVQMEKLEFLQIDDCKALLEIPQSDKVSMHLPCLKELELTDLDALVRTPDFGGLPSLQKLEISRCGSLQEIHPSIGSHSSLVHIFITSCPMLTRFPTIVRMEKLEILKIEDCEALLEIPQSNKVSMHLPCLKKLKLTNLDALVRTPDIGGPPSLQKLEISGCGSLEEIHPSIGSQSSLVHIFISSCPMLTRFPTIVRMEKLENFEISSCRNLLEFPNVEANMDSLENLYLIDVGIEVLPSSVGRYCTNLISLTLFNCFKLKTIEGNFHALKRLERFQLLGNTKLEKFPKDLFDVKCCLEELRLWVYGELNVFPPSPPHLPYLLRKLDLRSCELKDGEIPREIGGLSSLKELLLDYNHFSRVDINFSQLTRLKLLSLSNCEMLVELPELPPNLSVLKADTCNSLKAIGDYIYSNCKWLCSFSVKSDCAARGNFVGGKRLLESMLQGNGIENGECMSLILKGVEIPEEFEPPSFLRARGSRYTLELPENWFNEYTGFLFCFVFDMCVPNSIRITMGSSEDEQEEFYEKERKYTDIHTWMVYVSFGSLKSTTWWDQTSTVVDFTVAPLDKYGNVLKEYISFISGFGARLVSKKIQMKETTTKNSSSEFSEDDGDYKCKFQIIHDSKSKLECRFLSSEW